MFVGEGGIAEGSFGEGEEKEEGGKKIWDFDFEKAFTNKIHKTCGKKTTYR